MEAIEARNGFFGADFVDVDVGLGTSLADSEVLPVWREGATPELAAKGTEDVQAGSRVGVPNSRCAVPRYGCNQLVVRAPGCPHDGILVTKQLVLKDSTLHIPQIDTRERRNLTRAILGRLVLADIDHGFTSQR